MSRQNAEDLFRARLAAWLGITADELEEYAEDVEENNGDYGNAQYAYTLQFSKDTPPEVLDKLRRISRRNIVYFNLEELEPPAAEA